MFYGIHVVKRSGFESDCEYTKNSMFHEFTARKSYGHD